MITSHCGHVWEQQRHLQTELGTTQQTAVAHRAGSRDICGWEMETAVKIFLFNIMMYFNYANIAI